MNKSILLLIISATITACAGTSFKPGKYKSNYATYGRFITSIEIKEDSTFTKNFMGDMMNDNSYRKWTVYKDTLRLTFDTISYPNSRYRQSEEYQIKRNKLYFIVSKDQLKKVIKKSTWDSLTVKQQQKLLKAFNGKNTPVNFKGKMRKNYYVRSN